MSSTISTRPGPDASEVMEAMKKVIPLLKEIEKKPPLTKEEIRFITLAAKDYCEKENTTTIPIHYIKKFEQLAREHTKI
ncbi:MAG: hypothetical protein GY853_14395 [PVC group bacterium]|nr:hypothetical protein [PVC group bacterium]